MTKISQLVDLGANLAAGDEFVVRDVSDASTPNKKVTSSGFIDYVIAQGVGAGFTQIAAGAGPLARAQASSSGATGTLAFSTAAATTLIERARIDSSGRLLVGTSTAQSGTRSQYSRFTVQGNNQSTSDGAQVNLASNTNAPSLNTGDTLGQVIFTDNGPGEYGKIACQMDGAGAGTNDYPGRLVFSTTADGAASPTEAMRINNQQELLVGTATRTANGGKLQISNGITFPATAVACTDVNTLDDYEEGIWTPSYKATTTDPSVVYENINRGKYIKIGRKVYIQVTIQSTIVSSAGSGTLFVGGLPFAVQMDSFGGYASFAVGLNSAINVGAGERVVVMSEGGQGRIEIFAQNDDTGINSALTGSAINSMASARYLFFSGCYLTAS